MLFTAQLTPRARRAWLTLLLLSPVAYALGVWLTVRYDPDTRVGLSIDRQTAITRAAEYARTLGADVSEWTTGAKLEPDNDRYLYYSLQAPADAEIARRLAPELTARVVFVRPDGGERVRVALTKDGTPIGFSHKLPSSNEPPDRGEAEARRRATEAFAALASGADLSRFGEPKRTEERTYGGITREYTWSGKLPTLPQLDMSIEIGVRGDRVVSQDIDTKVESAYARKNLVNRQVHNEIAGVIYGIVIIVVFIYGLRRYIQRTRQKEVPHARSLLLAIVIALLFMFYAFQTDVIFFSTGEGVGNQYWVSFIGSSMAFLLMGLAIGMAYGSGEGDVREAYPGKLTSLDALITGKIFSRNVAEAVVVGSAFGGWALALSSLATLPWALLRPGGGQGLTDKTFEMLLSEQVWLLTFLSFPFGVLPVVMGLLLPLSFLHRKFRPTWRMYAALVFVSLLANTNFLTLRPEPLGAGILTVAVVTAVLLGSFFKSDLLSAIISVAALSFASLTIYLIAQPAPGLRRSGVIAVVGALLVLAAAFYFIRRGRAYREDEVRPLYARLLAERVGMQAEVSAAREAQVRLMPQALPTVEGLAVAAACRPAHEVGGDFYDLFPLGANRLGIFVAEGNERGLEAALTIAFAKGFLMPRLYAKGEDEISEAPAEVLARLQTRLAPMLEQDQRLAVLYAVVDTSAHTLCYAATASFPRVLLNATPAKDGSHSSTLKSALSAADSSSDGVREETLELRPGDALMVVTDGIAKSFRDDRKWERKLFSDVTTKRRGCTSSELQRALDDLLARRAKRARKIGIDDDLTAVVVCLSDE